MTRASNPKRDAMRGALWMLGAVASFIAMAIAARGLLRHMGAFEIVFWRGVAMLAIVLVLLPGSGGLGMVRTRRFGLHVLRNGAHFFGQTTWVFALSALPLATVFAIEFTLPLWTALLAAFMLGERITPPRAVMLALGLVGVLAILRPGMSFVHPAALVLVFGTMGFAAQFIFTKQLSATDKPLGIIFWMCIIQAPIGLVASVPGWVAPTLADAPWIGLIGLASYTAHYCITRAVKTADATVVVPIDFVRLPLVALIGALFYGEPLDPLVLVGAAVIFAGTYFSLSREARR
ncbi:MAG: DMT family transporter [Betaproteobacteria bacterium]